MRMRKGRNTVLLLLSLLFSMAAVAQRHEILNKNIRSLQVVANKDWLALPIMELGHRFRRPDTRISSLFLQAGTLRSRLETNDFAL